MIVIIDNYDSFTYNLVQYFGELGQEIRVFRNDAITVTEVEKLNPDHIVISPGPGTPADAGISKELIRELGQYIPILGVCLGQQCIGEVFGGKIVRAPRLMHGKTSQIHHFRKHLFAGLPSPFEATRYHSLIVTDLPDELEATAFTSRDELMGLQHREYPIFGVQFHPESFLTDHGKTLLKNFLAVKRLPVPSKKTRPATKEVAMPNNDLLKPFIARAMDRQDLTCAEAEQAMTAIMTGQATPAQIGGYLVALRLKGETVDEIVGSARAMRAVASRIELSGSDPIMDVVGTGGDGAHTINVSTAAAFIVAGTGQRVAKHGNRAASSQCGAADVLLALGANLDLLPEQVGQVIEDVGIGFMFAPKFHPAMKYAIGPRRELGQRTIFNILGPLTNPAGATHLLVGVYDAGLTQTIAEVLGGLGGQAAFVVHGHGGLDELTTSGPNRVSRLQDGQVKTYQFDAAELGLRPASKEDLRGGEPAQNAEMLRNLLTGKDQSVRRDVVLLNAAAAISTTDHFDVGAALKTATESLDSGAALEKLDAFIAKTQALGYV
jgi:anthranilate synthase/phosphoribosyltransferase